MTHVFVGLGANLGEPLKQIVHALGLLHAHPAMTVEAVASFYRSPPMGPTDQPDFYNTCARLETNLSPHALLAELKKIERDMGRTITRRWGERVIDLDILLYGNLVVNTDDLTIPHPGLGHRAFVDVPLSEIIPPDYTPAPPLTRRDLRGQNHSDTLAKVPSPLGHFAPLESTHDRTN
jgi:2-amino-4-hydroxy-6-hydroxymethyldihydropteridine diphosphokinase